MSEAVLPLFKDERVREWQHVGRLVRRPPASARRSG